MNIVFVFLYIVFFTNSLMTLTKKSFLKCLPFTFILSGLSLFISGFIFKTFYVGLIISILFSFLFIIKDLLIDKVKFKDFKSKYLTKDLLGFAICYLLVIIYDFNRAFTHWDEMSHWGKMVKDMFRLDSFYTNDLSNLMVHKDYPPIISLIELFFTYISGKYNEIYLIRILHLFEGSIVISGLSLLKNNKKEITYKTLYVTIFAFLITLLFDTAFVINSIYTDYILALSVAYILIYILNTKKFKLFELITLSVLLVYLMLLKQVSIAFYLVVVFMLIINLIIDKNKFNIKRVLQGILLVGIIPLATLVLWRSHVASFGITGQFDLSLITPANFVAILKGSGGEAWQHEAAINYGYAIMEKNFINTEVINLSFFQVFIILEGVFLILRLSRKDKKYTSLLLTNIVGTCGYVLMMLLLYVYAFGEGEGPTIASFDRYMSTYVLIWLYLILFQEIESINLKNIKNNLIMLFIVMVLITPTSYLKIRPDQILIRNTKYDKYIEPARVIDEYATIGDKVFIIDQTEHDGAPYNLVYYSDKVTFNLSHYVFDNVDNPKEYFETVYKDTVKEYDYFYTYNITEDVINNYSFLSKDGLEASTLYKIVTSDNNIKLEKIN